jgi:branched-subunit amino acid transport protein
MIWFLILFSATTAYLFRFLPFLIRDSKLLNNKQGSFYRFLNYSSQAMLGVIVYETVFHQAAALNLISHFNTTDFLKISLLTATFIWVAISKKILPSFFTGLIIYFAYMTWVLN